MCLGLVPAAPVGYQRLPDPRRTAGASFRRSPIADDGQCNLHRVYEQVAIALDLGDPALLAQLANALARDHQQSSGLFGGDRVWLLRFIGHGLVLPADSQAEATTMPTSAPGSIVVMV